VTETRTRGLSGKKYIGRMLCFALVSHFLRCYNGQRGAGGKTMQWFFYLYYPAHMLLLALVRIFVLK